MSRFARIPVLLTVAAALVGGAATAHADEHVLVLLDTTGSMDLNSVPGKTRLQVAKERIATFLTTVPSVPTRYALWFFEGSTYTPIYSFSDGATAAAWGTALLCLGPEAAAATAEREDVAALYWIGRDGAPPELRTSPAFEREWRERLDERSGR